MLGWPSFYVFCGGRGGVVRPLSIVFGSGGGRGARGSAVLPLLLPQKPHLPARQHKRKTPVSTI